MNFWKTQRALILLEERTHILRHAIAVCLHWFHLYSDWFAIPRRGKGQAVVAAPCLWQVYAVYPLTVGYTYPAFFIVYLCICVSGNLPVASLCHVPAVGCAVYTHPIVNLSVCLFVFVCICVKCVFVYLWLCLWQVYAMYPQSGMHSAFCELVYLSFCVFEFLWNVYLCICGSVTSEWYALSLMCSKFFDLDEEMQVSPYFDWLRWLYIFTSLQNFQNNKMKTKLLTPFNKCKLNWTVFVLAR